MWVINTTNSLRLGMIVDFEDPNEYGDDGPYIWTTGSLPLSDTGEVAIPTLAGSTQWNMYDGFTGNYVGSIVNGTSPSLITTDGSGNIIGYYFNTTAGTMGCGTNGITDSQYGGGHVNEVSSSSNPALCMWNMTEAMGLNGNGITNWTPSLHAIWLFKNGIEFADNGANYDNITAAEGGINGGVPQTETVALTTLSEMTGNVIVGQYGGVGLGTSVGYEYEFGYDATTGNQLWAINRTDTNIGDNVFAYFTRYSSSSQDYSASDGIYLEFNFVNLDYVGFYTATGGVAYTGVLPPTTGETSANPYNIYDLAAQCDPTLGITVIWGFGGDVWGINQTNGNVIWSFNTNSVNGSPGEETPYGVNPLWIFQDWCMGGQGATTTMYLPEGHEYAPPLFHNAQMLAINVNTGVVTWNELGFYDTTSAIADGIVTALNDYDGQVYAWGQGPSATTVTAPHVGVSTTAPVVISGTVMDVSPGASQEVTKADFPNGLPAVSDASQSLFMATVYEQQPIQSNVTGVPVTLTDIDPNGNYETIGTTTSSGYTGYYSIAWTPPIAGNYTITATFAGSNSYYGSYSTTSIYAAGAAATPSPAATPQSLTPVSNDVIGLGIAAIVVIIVIGAVLALLMLRKKP